MMGMLVLASAATFNLVCSGTLESKSVYSETSAPYSYTYRIDLDKKVYCDGECKATHAIAEIQPTQIILSQTKVDSPSETSWSVNRVDRETGIHKVVASHKNPRNRVDMSIMTWNGTCEKQPFSGFPTFETKF